MSLLFINSITQYTLFSHHGRVFVKKKIKELASVSYGVAITRNCIETSMSRPVWGWGQKQQLFSMSSM